MEYLAKIVVIVGFSVLWLSCAPPRVSVKSPESRQVLIGKVINNDHSVAKNALVSLFDVKIKSSYDSICKSYSTLTSSNGYFILKDIPDGTYLLYVYDTALGRCNLSQIQKKQTSYQFDTEIVLEPLVTMKGKIAPKGQCDIDQVLIPGFGAAAQVDDMGNFTLPDVPAGKYDLVLIGKKINYAAVNILKIPGDTIFLGEFDPCTGKNSDPVYSNL